jgi:GTP-binding protein
MEWIRDNELIEVTPKTIRIRMRDLDPSARARAAKEQ